MIRKYFLLFISTVIILCGCAGATNFSIDLSEKYSIVSTSAHMVTIAPKREFGWGENLIPTEVIEVGWNQHYLVAKQRDISNLEGKELEDLNKGTMYYWILHMDSGKTDGPLNYDELMDKKMEYTISDAIEMVEASELNRVYDE